IVVVCSKKEDDCLIHDREYYLFDTGMATAFLILRATELGFVAHPIAGYSPRKTREVLGIPEEFQVITLVNVGLKSETLNPVLSEKQIHDESERPPRKPFEQFACHNKWTLS
ncbi:MAG: nitroreductase, partial [Caldiserica bacterium]|nr:nitroreductase [Caldisericota bacterium]